jgi:hypothetical protein
MSSGNKKKENQYEGNVQTALQAANVPTAEETAQHEAAAKFRNWMATPGQDILSAPGMNFATDIYGNANAMAAQSRVGDPRNAFTANLPGFNNQLRQQMQENLYNTRAQGLSNAFSQAKAEALGQGDVAAQMEMQRKQQYAQGQQQFLTSWYNRPQKPPLWQTIAGLAIGGLSAAGTAGGTQGVGGLIKAFS